MSRFDDFDELYVISDLHIGGQPGFQIFDQGDLLSRFIDYVTARPGKVGLVINGDSVDFLAEAPYKYFDFEGAIGKLDRMLSDSNFKPVWESLGKLVKKRRHYLVITLGNHDLELALPWVLEHFRDRLADHDDTARGRIHFVFDGSGFACTGAGTSTLCVHGNDVDPFNYTSYERLRETGADFIQARRADPWTPNAGTKLVIDVMNEIKQTHPFVDLLKPETGAVVPILAEIVPDAKDKLEKVWDVAQKLTWDRVKKTFRPYFLSGEDQEENQKTQSLHSFLGDSLPKTTRRAGLAASGDDLLVEVESYLSRDPFEFVSATEGAQQLGGVGAIWKKLTGAESHEVLFEALEGLKKDRSFDLDDKDDVYKETEKLASSTFQIVTTGHTHLERVLPRSKGPGTYINSGTWVPLMRLSDEVLGDEGAFKEMFNVLKSSRTLRDLKRARVRSKDLVMHLPAAVRVDRKGGQLCRVTLSGEKIRLEPVTKSSKQKEHAE